MWVKIHPELPEFFSLNFKKADKYVSDAKEIVSPKVSKRCFHVFKKCSRTDINQGKVDQKTIKEYIKNQGKKRGMKTSKSEKDSHLSKA